MRHLAISLLLAAAAAAPACGPKRPMTVWPYSSWLSMDGVAAEQSFEEARSTCLARSGVREPEAVVPGSEKEQEFTACMEAERWCTEAAGCE